MEALTIYYSVSNGGDGSAYPHWFESMELAEWDQEHMYEGWGESCTGSITVESMSAIKLADGQTLNTKESYLIEDLDPEDLEEFKNEFFPNGLPTFEVKENGPTSNEDYIYVDIYADGELVVERKFTRKDKDLKEMENNLNSL